MKRCLFLVLAVATLTASAERHDAEAHDGHLERHGGIHVAVWRWHEIGVFYTFTLFVIICGLAKIGFHHAHSISAHIPESCLMILVGVVFGVVIHQTYDRMHVKPGLLGNGTCNDTMCFDHPGDFQVPKFTPKTFFYVLLPPVILEAAYSLYDRAFADNISTVMLYAGVGTLLNTFSIGSLLFLLFRAGAVGEMFASVESTNAASEMLVHVGNATTTMGLTMSNAPKSLDLTMTECLVFSALISAVDPVAVLAIFQEIGVNKDLYYLVFGESLFNDAVTVVLYSTMVAFSEMPTVSGGEYGLAVLAFFASSLGGLTIGVLFGLLTALITRTTREIRVVEPLAVLGIAYLSYLSAELFHFSGIISIIGCGLTQAHYALKNVSHKSYTTVIYFTKMLSSTSDAIIFLFLGMVVVADHHDWHTGFVLWTLALCLLCRFAGVYLLTALANAFRVSPINLQEQFLMAYGGLRGAVAFSLVQMLDPKTVEPRQVFVTTTLVVIFFTVFIQGATIKPLVSWLKIKKDLPGRKQMVDEINENIISNLMAGVEEITGFRGDNYIRQKLEFLDEHYMQKIFLGPDFENDLTKLYKKLTLVEHFAHLYGPVALVEDKRADLLRQSSCQSDQPVNASVAEVIRKDSLRRRKVSVPRKQSDAGASGVPGVQVRDHKRGAASSERGSASTSIEISGVADLRKAFKNYPGKKFPSREPDEGQQLRAQLLQRHITARAITAVVNRLSLPAGSMSLPTDRRTLPSALGLVDAELEENYPEEAEGLDAIMRRASLRRQRSLPHGAVGVGDAQNPFVVRPVPALADIRETEMEEVSLHKD